MKYPVKIEYDGAFVKVGSIDDTGFSYDPEYLEKPEARSISISLPLQKETFSPEQTECYFDGLLPEGFTRRAVADRMHVSDSDYLSLLACLGRECLGAVQISDTYAQEEADYRKLTLQEVGALAAEGAEITAKIVTESHLSLTGASGKVGLYYDEISGNWFQPYGIAPSTHIVKQSHVRLRNIVINELLCNYIAEKCGIPVPECRIISTGGSSDGEILFAGKRYDRSFERSVVNINGLAVPCRLHQEDFAQALGIASRDKYEPRNGSYMKKMFDLLRHNSADPLQDQQVLWKAIVFNFLIGNTDDHLKNFSLLYNSSLSGIRLAPIYDMVSTAVYETGTRQLSMRIGDAGTQDEVTRKSFVLAASEIGIGHKFAMQSLDSLCSKFEQAVEESSKELVDQGFARADEIKDRILKHGGYGRML